MSEITAFTEGQARNFRNFPAAQSMAKLKKVAYRKVTVSKQMFCETFPD